ncbi:MAG: hypothetical protein ACTSYM_05805 [Candidatus Baldrarchaeia archaeon]
MSDKLEKFLKALEKESKFKESSILKMFKPRRLSLYDVTPEAIKEQLRRLPKKVITEEWPLNVCRYIKVCLDRGGYAVSFYPFKMNSETFAQCRCLQHEETEWKHGNVPSAVIEIPKQYYSIMRSRIGEWREIWHSICKEGEILKESVKGGER